MPTNRAKIKRISQSTNTSIESYVRWHFGITPYLDPHITGGSPWSGGKGQEFWEKNKDAILTYLKQKKGGKDVNK
jgi:hypothetical protein